MKRACSWEDAYCVSTGFTRSCWRGVWMETPHRCCWTFGGFSLSPSHTHHLHQSVLSSCTSLKHSRSTTSCVESKETSASALHRTLKRHRIEYLCSTSSLFTFEKGKFLKLIYFGITLLILLGSYYVCLSSLIMGNNNNNNNNNDANIFLKFIAIYFIYLWPFIK